MIDDARKAVLQKVCRMLGYDPVGMGDLLAILAHPDVIDLTRKYLDAADKG